jgi:hypothetical protein
MTQSATNAVKNPKPGISGRDFFVTCLGGVLWLSVVITGLALIFIYSNSPGRAGAAPVGWPVKSQIADATNAPLLVMFAHPQCPCTRASLGELAQLMSDCQGHLKAQVWFVKPAGTTGDWINTALWHTAGNIPGVSVYCDTNGVEARRFQAETSGQTMLYDQNGRLLFQGGITIARGHFGDNPALDAVEALVKGKSSAFVKTPVFGCALFDDPIQ